MRAVLSPSPAPSPVPAPSLDVAPLRSTVTWSDGTTRADANGFVTALAAREVRRAGDAVPPAWLDHLESCRRPDGAYGFWPRGATPAWAPDLPPDSDDTAVLLLELTLAGRVPTARARSVACHTVGSHRLGRVLDPGPPWLRQGMFTTWHRAGCSLDLVDLTAVTNVLALLHTLGLTRVPGVAAALDALAAGVEWAGESSLRWGSVTPFYPEPDELARALDHAADWGVPGAEGWAAAVRRACPRTSDAVCSMAYGPPTWHSADLAAVRGGEVRALTRASR